MFDGAWAWPGNSDLVSRDSLKSPHSTSWVNRKFEGIGLLTCHDIELATHVNQHCARAIADLPLDLGGHHGQKRGVLRHNTCTNIGVPEFTLVLGLQELP